MSNTEEPQQYIIPVNAVVPGTVLVADGGFTCLSDGAEVVVKEATDGLYVECSEGQHSLDGQLDLECQNYVGFIIKKEG